MASRTMQQALVAARTVRCIASSSRAAALSTASTETTAPPPAPSFDTGVVATSTSPQASSSAAFSWPATPRPRPEDPFIHVPLSIFASQTAPTTEPQVVTLPAPLFNVPSRPDILHRIVVAHLAGLRQGTASTKNRGEVNYSGRKLRPQKGTGRARLGDRGSPMLRGGGRAFGPRPKGPDGWSLKVNRKENELGLRVAASEKWRSGNLFVVDKLTSESVSTREAKQKLGARDWLNSLLVMAPTGESENEQDEAGRAKLELSVANLPQVDVLRDMADLNVYEMLLRKKLVVELDALQDLCYRMNPRVVWEEADEEDWEEFDELVNPAPSSA